MKDLQSYKEEIFRRSEKRILKRRRVIRRWVGAGASFCLCLIAAGALLLSGRVEDYQKGKEPEAAPDGEGYHQYSQALDSENQSSPPKASGSDEKGGIAENSSSSIIKVVKSKGYANISLYLPKTWKYEWVDGIEESFSLKIAPKEAKEGWIRIEYSNAFGVCGTGLSVEKIKIGGYDAEKGTYDEGAVWDYIHLENTPGEYTLYAENISKWWSAYEIEAMEIFDSLQVGVGVVAEYKAVVLAKKECDQDYPHHWAEFDSKMGSWKIHFFESYEQMRNEFIVVLDHSGKVLKAGK